MFPMLMFASLMLAMPIRLILPVRCCGSRAAEILFLHPASRSSSSVLWARCSALATM